MEPRPIAEIELHPRTDEELRIHDWRAEQLQALGLPQVIADWFADHVDWHAVAALVERGCPAGLAIEIVR